MTDAKAQKCDGCGHERQRVTYFSIEGKPSYVWECRRRGCPSPTPKVADPEAGAVNSHAKWLRQVTVEIRKEGLAGWGNTCEWAADELDALQSQLSKLQQQNEALRDEFDAVVERLREMERVAFAAEARAALAEKDAARYRWLRDECKDIDICEGLGWLSQDVGIDAYIDAAISGEGT